MISYRSAAQRIEWIAHRGESHLAPENTLAAFELAWKLGADAVELDVHVTADLQLIVSHDADTQRTAGIRLPIKEHTLAVLRKLDVGRWKGDPWAGQPMPTLDEVLATVPKGKRLFIEIKVGAEAVPPLVAALDRAGTTPAQTAIISFHADTLAAARNRLPHVRTYYLSSFTQDAQTKRWTPTVDDLIRTAKEIGADGLNLVDKPPLDRELANATHLAGLSLYAWTIDDPAAAMRLLDLGVAGITTNRAAWLRDQLRDPAPG